MALAGHPFQKIGAVLKAVAPTMLTAVGGPAGALAATIIKGGFGDKGMTDQAMADVVTAATTSADGLAKLKQIEADLQKAELDNGFKFADLEVQDRESARDLAKTTGITPQVSLTVLFIVGYFVALGFFFFTHSALPMSEAFVLMLGVLTAGVPQILAFWFGSSHSSQSKDVTIATLGAKE